MYLSFINNDRGIHICLGIIFGLAFLNKMSSLVIFVSFVILSFMTLERPSKDKIIKKLPTFILKVLLKYKYVYVACLLTTLPYLLYRMFETSGDAVVPYASLWRTFSGNVTAFDFLKYLKWFVVYLGQLNISTGLFLAPLSVLVMVQLCKSNRREKRILGSFCIIVSTGVMGLAVLQSGYNLSRLTERHFFVLTPLVLMLSFMWFQYGKKATPIAKAVVVLIFVVATWSSLFIPSNTCGPAIDSAFIDSLSMLISQGANALAVKSLILGLSTLLTILGLFIITKKRDIILIVLIFMVAITVPCYVVTIVTSEMAKKEKMPLMRWINKSISTPANLIFLGCPRTLVIDHIIWNRDNSNKIFFQARHRLENPTDFKFKDYVGVKRELDSSIPTYFISPFFNFCGATSFKSKDGILMYESMDPGNTKICGFLIDFGAPYNRQALGKGWSVNEGPYPQSGFPTFVWATGKEATLDFFIEELHNQVTLSFRAKPFQSGQFVNILLNGKNIADVKSELGWHEYRLLVGSDKFVPGKNQLTFDFQNTKLPTKKSSNSRNLTMAFDWLSIGYADGKAVGPEGGG